MKKNYVFLVYLFCVAPYIWAAESRVGIKAQMEQQKKECKSCFKKLSWISPFVVAGGLIGHYAGLPEEPAMPEYYPAQPKAQGFGCGSIAMSKVLDPYNTYVNALRPTCSNLNASSPEVAECSAASLLFTEMNPSVCSQNQSHPCYSDEEVGEILPRLCKLTSIDVRESAASNKLQSRIRVKENARKKINT